MKFSASAFVVILLPLSSYALECPRIPEQARKDWDVQVKAAVGKIGPATGAELETLTRTVTKDLMSKLPQADKVYLEQMMFASYCSALRDDKTLSESERATRIKAYRIEVTRTLYGQPGPPAKEPAPKGGALSPADARMQLSQMSLAYTPQAFINSVKNRDTLAVKLFLTAGMDPNVTDEKGITAMMYAAREGYNEIIEALLKAKGDVNKETEGGATALSWAVWGEKVGTLRVLLDHGARVEAINRAFVDAAAKGNLEILRLLLSRGADVNKVGAQALSYAVGSRSIGTIEKRLSETVEFLLGLGADVNTTSDEGWTPLLYAASNGYASVARVLIENRADINAKCVCRGYSGGGWTALMIAIHTDHIQVAEILLRNGADVNQRSTEGVTALIVAAGRHDVNFVRALLDKGADINAKTDKGWLDPTALLAAAKDEVDIVRTLLERGAAVNEKDSHGSTALMRASRWPGNNVDIIRTLLEWGAAVNEKDNDGLTALMIASRSPGKVHIIRTLLERGAAVNEKNNDGKTALALAQEKWAEKTELGTELIRVLKQAGAR